MSMSSSRVLRPASRPRCVISTAGTARRRHRRGAPRLLAERGVLVFPGSLSAEEQVGSCGVFGRVLDEAHDGSMHLRVDDGGVARAAGAAVVPFRQSLHAAPLEMLSLYGDSVDDRSASTLYVDNRRLPPSPAGDGGRTRRRETVEVPYYFFGQGGDRPSRSVTPDHPEAPLRIRRSGGIPSRASRSCTSPSCTRITSLAWNSRRATTFSTQCTGCSTSPARCTSTTGTSAPRHLGQPGGAARAAVPDGELDLDAEPRSPRASVVGAKDYVEQMEEAAAGSGTIGLSRSATHR
jgi:hypothetical protein